MKEELKAKEKTALDKGFWGLTLRPLNLNEGHGVELSRDGELLDSFPT